MPQFNEKQIKDKALSGASLIAGFQFYDETEDLVIGDVRFWKLKKYEVLNVVTGVLESDLTQAPDISGDWKEVVDYGLERVEFETFSLEGASYPLTASILNSRIFTISAVRMRGNFDSYANFLFDVDEQDVDDIHMKGLQFADIDTLVTWCNNNLTNDGSVFNAAAVFRVYAIRNSEKYDMHKIHGRNYAYGIIKGNKANGRSNYYKSECAYDTTYEHIDNLAIDILERLTGVTPASTSLAKRALWFTRNPQNFYKLYPSSGASNPIEFEGGISSQRRTFNSVGNTFSSVSGGTFTPISTGNAIYSVRLDNYIWNFEGIQNINDRDYFNHNKSYIKVHGFQDASGNIAAIIKPIGMDEFRLNTTKTLPIHLYGGYGNGDDKMKIKLLRSGVDYDIVNNIGSNVLVTVNKTALINGQNEKAKGSPSNETLRDIIFFYGDDNGHISRYSKKVKWLIKRPGAKIYAMLE